MLSRLFRLEYPRTTHLCKSSRSARRGFAPRYTISSGIRLDGRRDDGRKLRCRETMRATTHVGLLRFGGRECVRDCKNYIVPATCYRSLSRAKSPSKSLAEHLTASALFHSACLSVRMHRKKKFSHSLSPFFISFFLLFPFVLVG